jgi:hypothetical protein
MTLQELIEQWKPYQTFGTIHDYTINRTLKQEELNALTLGNVNAVSIKMIRNPEGELTGYHVTFIPL